MQASGELPVLAHEETNGQRRAADAKARAVARGAAVNLLGTLAGAVEPLLLVVISRSLGTVALGQYVLATTYVALFMRLAVMGLDRGLLRHVPLALAQAGDAGSGTNRQLEATLGTGLRYTLGLGCLAAAALGFGAKIVLAAAGDDASSENARWLMWFALSLPAQALTTSMLFALRGLHDMATFVIVRSAIMPLAQFAITAALIALGVGANALVAGFLAAHVITALCALHWFKKGFPQHPVGALARSPRDAALLQFSWPLGLTELLNLLVARADVLLIAFFIPGRPDLVAVYSMAAMVSGVIKKVRQGFDTSLAPVLAEQLVREETGLLRLTYTRIARWVYTLFLALGGALAFGSPLVLAALGPEHVSAWPLVGVLLLGRLVNAAAGPAQTVLLMAGHARLELLNNVFGVIAQVVLAWLLVPRFGLTGAAFASSAALLLFNGLRVFQARWLVGVTPDLGDAGRLTVAAVAAALPGAVLIGYAPGTLLAHAAAALVFVAAFPALLWMFGLRDELSALARWTRASLRIGGAR